MAAAGASEASAATIGINTTQDEITAGDHLCSLREAIDTVSSAPGNGDCAPPGGTTTIVLGPRTYVLTSHPAGVDDNATGDLNLATSSLLTIAGAGSGKTRIDATGLGDRALNVDAATHVTLSRLAVTGGHAPDGQPGFNGDSGGVFTPTAGTDGASGGGIKNAGTLILRLVLITANHAGDGGAGGGSDYHSYPSAPGGDGGGGGGIENVGTLTVEDSTIRGNTAGRGGAGGHKPATTNYDSGTGGTGGDGGYGGGIFNGGGTTTLTRSTVSNNFAGIGGAGGDAAASPYGSPAGGSAGGGGGGGGIAYGALNATNSTIAENFAGGGGRGGNGSDARDDGYAGGSGGAGGDAGAGGGYGTVFAGARLTNVTLSGNAVGPPGHGGNGGLGVGMGAKGSAGPAGGSASGGGIASFSAAITLTNSIVASNAGGACAGGAADGGHNLVFPADPGCPFGLHSDPLLKDLGSYGGPTKTQALKPRSPAISKVPPKGASCPLLDQRGVRRPRGPACEIGAFEFVLPVVTISTPRDGATYKQGKRVRAKFACREAGGTTLISSCVGTVRNAKLLNTSKPGKKTFKVTAVDRAGNRTTKTVHYTVKKKRRK